MNVLIQEYILITFFIFCRVGGCLMVMPVFSSPRINMQARLFIAIAASLTVMPMLADPIKPIVKDLKSSQAITIIAVEVFAGTLIGLMGRVFFLALQFMAVAVATFVGMGNIPGSPIDGSDPVPAVTELITLTATVLFVITNLHVDVIAALVQSYEVLPLAKAHKGISNISDLVSALTHSFRLALQITSPFIIYAVVVNLTFGIVNKLIPQIPVYFVSFPFVIAGGLYLLFVTLSELMRLFVSGFSSWLAAG